MQEKIDQVVHAFDFHRVHECMTALQHRWYTAHSNSLEIPTIDRMKKVASSLLEHATRHAYASSGGFEAYYYKEDQEFQLKFVLTQTSTSKIS